MGGESTNSQTQSSQTSPWDTAQPMLKSILGQLQGNLANTGVTGAESGALNTQTNNANNFSAAYAPQIGSYANNLLQGGGANNQAGAVNAAYKQYYDQTNPLASNLNYDPNQNPGTASLVDQIRSDVSNQVNGQFAGAGRDLSGLNVQALGRGVAQGAAPVLFDQYNANRAAQQGAAGNLYNAGNMNAGILSGMQQQYLANQGQGVTAAGQALDASNTGANATLQAEAARRGIPVQALGLLAQMGIPIAGLGSQSTGQSNGTQQMSGAQQFGTIASGIGNILGGAGNFMKYMPSDQRLKDDISKVGMLFDGTPVYLYRYKNSLTWQIGLMAQDVEKSTPAAVIDLNGFKAVDYQAATEASRKLGEAA